MVKSVKYTFQGQTYNLTLNDDTGKYEATITSPQKSSYKEPDHKYGGKIDAEDDAGNTTTVDQTHSSLGESLKIRVIEKVAPTISITYPTSGAFITNANPEIRFTVSDSDSGINETSIQLLIDSQPITGEIQKSESGDGYECSYTPDVALDDGSHTITVNVMDNDGNSANEQTQSFTIDTTPPTLEITQPTEGLITNSNSVTVIGTTNDITSKPVTLTINGEIVEVQSDGNFEKEVSLISGNNQITIIATDKAGKSTTIVRNVILDTGAPVIHSITITPNPVDAGKTFIISVEVTD